MALESLATLMGSGGEMRGDLDQLTTAPLLCLSPAPPPGAQQPHRPPSPLDWEMLQNPIHLLGDRLSWDIHTSQRSKDTPF